MSGSERVGRLVSDEAVERARRSIRETDERTLADMEAVVVIPAPPFGETERGEWMLGRFESLGLEAVERDEAGNVLGRLPGREPDAAPVILSAHLDTVFDEGTDLTVRRDGARIRAPGIADDARGLAAILAIVRALGAAGLVPRRPLALAATVGEEGRGDLRGVKHLFREDGPYRRAAAFMTLDGTGLDRVIDRGVGSRRYRATIRGPGGHSWSDWGLANPVHAVGAATAALAEIRLRSEPRTVLSVTRLGGGTSVNAIPQSAWLELDLRSVSPEVLEAMDERVREAIRRAVAAANRRRKRGTERLELELELIGDRPAGQTEAGALIVEAADAATRAVGVEPRRAASSTDANVPMALGIPAVGMGAGGRSGGMHTTDEWYENEGGPEGIERALLVALAVLDD